VRLANLRPEEVGGLVQARQIRLFGVASAARLSGFTKIPTLKEMGWDVQVEGMKGLAAPAGLPDAAATSLHDRFRGAMQTPSWRTFIERTGAIEGYLDGPSFQSKMTRMIDGLRAALKPARPQEKTRAMLEYIKRAYVIAQTPFGEDGALDPSASTRRWTSACATERLA
jgi:tripartite-type tricarboxylate transporter receptor subunit TctC